MYPRLESLQSINSTEGSSATLLPCIRFTPRFQSQDLNSFERLAFLIPIFGWFHVLIAYGNSLHHQYFSTRASFGL